MKSKGVADGIFVGMPEFTNDERLWRCRRRAGRRARAAAAAAAYRALAQGQVGVGAGTRLGPVPRDLRLAEAALGVRRHERSNAARGAPASALHAHRRGAAVARLYFFK